MSNWCKQSLLHAVSETLQGYDLAMKEQANKSWANGASRRWWLAYKDYLYHLALKRDIAIQKTTIKCKCLLKITVEVCTVVKLLVNPAAFTRATRMV